MFASSVYQVGPGEAGVVLRFGAYERTTGARSAVQTALSRSRPFRLSDVTDDPLRYAGFDTPQEALMVTRDENIVDISFTVQWQVDPANVRDYLSSMCATRQDTGSRSMC
jgi:membrane protease subunit HflK